jgi:hypothetical protein
MAIVTVLFRPFPFEAHNAQSLIASAEGTVLLGMFVAGRRRLRGVPRALKRSPYVAYCLVYTILFCLIFSTFSNFGILTRERVQVFPMVLVFLALPLAAAGQRRQGRTAWKERMAGAHPEKATSFHRPQPVLTRRHAAPVEPAGPRPLQPAQPMQPPRRAGPPGPLPSPRKSPGTEPDQQ